jgi:hypothetical protein
MTRPAALEMSSSGSRILRYIPHGTESHDDPSLCLAEAQHGAEIILELSVEALRVLSNEISSFPPPTWRDIGLNRRSNTMAPFHSCDNLPDE